MKVYVFGKKALAVLMLMSVMSACSTTSTIEVVDESAFAESFTIDTVVVNNATGEEFDIDIEAMLGDAVREELSDKNLSGVGGLDYTLKVSIIQYEKGNAFARWVMPGLGKTVLSVEATLVDANERVLAESQATRSVGAGGGYTIGAWKAVFSDVADSLVADLLTAK